MTDSVSSVLVVILDCDVAFWSARHKEIESAPELISFGEMVEQIMLFMNAYLMLHARNRLAFIANHPTSSKFLFPRSNAGDTQGNFLENVSFLLHELKEIGKIEVTNQVATSQFSAALSMALCYINKAKKQMPINDQTDYRVLVIQGSEDTASQYIPMMNCIFTAQKIGVIVDACVISKKESTFLQQATDLTNGCYLRLADAFQKAILQQLFTVFLPDRESRKLLNISLQNDVDFRASCFCHRKTIDTGYVCSVCLSIFCEFLPICTTCGTKFHVPRPKKSKKIKN